MSEQKTETVPNTIKLDWIDIEKNLVRVVCAYKDYSAWFGKSRAIEMIEINFVKPISIPFYIKELKELSKFFDECDEICNVKGLQPLPRNPALSGLQGLLDDLMTLYESKKDAEL